MSEVHLTINSQSVTASRGQTILEAARTVGIDIPTLCYHPALSSHGACRMCLVEVKGMRGLQTACTCPVAEGIKVETNTEAVIEGRRFELELLFSERNHYCMYCPVSGDCELQELAYRYGLDHWRYPRTYHKMAVDASNHYFVMDPNRCILCTRCVRACAEIAANHTLGLRERGSRSMIMADVSVPLGESSCVNCGACLQVCPTGALIDVRGVYGGHEEDLTHTLTTCIQCSVGCALDVVTRGNRLLRVEGVWDSDPSGGLLCVDGCFKPLYDERQRITTPQIRRNGTLTLADWDEALDIVAKKLKNGSALGLAACATTNEALSTFARLFARNKAGRMEPAAPQLGYGRSAQLQDILAADLIVVAGAHPLSHQRVVGYFIKRAVDQGAHLALLDLTGSDLEDYATLLVNSEDAGLLIGKAAHVERAVVVYGVDLTPGAIKALKPLGDQSLFLALDAARNGKGAEAVGLEPLDVEEAEVLYFLLGEQRENGAMVGRLNGAFTIVQACYYSPLIEHADVVLPTPLWAERSGHFTNLEGKVFSLNAALPMPENVREEAEVLDTLIAML